MNFKNVSVYVEVDINPCLCFYEPSKHGQNQPYQIRANWEMDPLPKSHISISDNSLSHCINAFFKAPLKICSWIAGQPLKRLYGSAYYNNLVRLAKITFLMLIMALIMSLYLQSDGNNSEYQDLTNLR